MTGDIRSSRPGPSRLPCSTMLARPSPRVLCWRYVWKDEEFAARHRIRVIRDGLGGLIESGTSANGGAEIAPEQLYYAPLQEDNLRQRFLRQPVRDVEALQHLVAKDDVGRVQDRGFDSQSSIEDHPAVTRQGRQKTHCHRSTDGIKRYSCLQPGGEVVQLKLEVRVRTHEDMIDTLAAEPFGLVRRADHIDHLDVPSAGEPAEHLPQGAARRGTDKCWRSQRVNSLDQTERRKWVDQAHRPALVVNTIGQRKALPRRRNSILSPGA